MTYTYDMIVEKLREYPMLQERMNLLRFELSNVAHASENDILDSLAYGTPSYETATGGNTDKRDRIMKVALSYKNLAAKMNDEAVADVLKEMDELGAQIERMDYYISLLTEDQRRILQLYYFLKKSWYDIESETNYSRRTLTKRRNEAIVRLAEMYNYMGEILNK